MNLFPPRAEDCWLKSSEEAYRVVGVEQTKVSHCREEFSLHRPGEGMADARASSQAVRRAEGRVRVLTDTVTGYGSKLVHRLFNKTK